MGFQEDIVKQIELLQAEIDELKTQEISTTADMQFASLTTDQIGVLTDNPDVPLHILKSGTSGTPSASSATLLMVQQTGGAGNNASISIIAGNAANSNLNFGDTDDENDGILRYIHSAQAMAFLVATSEVMRLVGTKVGIGTTTPDQILSTNEGGGNALSDGWDSYVSISAKKNDIADLPNTLKTLVATPPKTFKRKPFVSAEELRQHAIKTHFTEWIAEFGGKMEDGELVGDDYRGGKLPAIKNAELLAVVNAEADRLRAARRNEHKWKREFSGPVLDEPGWDKLPNVLIKNEDGQITGWNMESYVASQHQAIIELSKTVDVLTARVAALEGA